MKPPLPIRLLLRLYPRSFQREYGAAMAETFALRKSAARAHGRGMVRFHARELSSLLLGAMTEHAANRRDQVRSRERSGAMLLSNTGRELRHTIRRLARSPGFTLASVLTLGLAIGATTAIYAVVDAVVFRALPFPDSGRIVYVDHGAPGLNLSRDLAMTEGLYVHYRRGARTLQELAIYSTEQRNLTGGGPAERVQVAYVTPSLGAVLGARPQLGRWLLEEEGHERWGAVAVLSHGLWQSRFGGDPAAIGQTIYLNGREHEIVGVMSETFVFPDPATAMWVPVGIFPAKANLGGFNYRGVGRLRDGATLDDLTRELRALIATLPEAFADQPFSRELVENARLFPVPATLKEHMIGGIRLTLWVLLGTVSVVLLIACANVANLYLVRAEGRRLEVAVRRALGAGRARLVSEHLTEALLLGTAGGALGALLGAAGIRLLVAHGPASLPRLYEVGFDLAALGFAVACGLMAGALFGSIPLLSLPAVGDTMREAGRRTTAARTRLHTRNVLVVAQIALAFVLLVAGGLMVRSFVHLSRVDPGFDADNVLTFSVVLPGTKYESVEQAVAFHETVLERARAIPGVAGASAATCIPLRGWCWGDPLMAEGRPVPEGTIPPIANFRRVFPGYFETMRIPLKSGRALQPQDGRGETNGVVISEELARLYFPGEDPLGRRLYFMVDAPAESGSSTIPWFTVVGVVPNLAVSSITHERASPTLYLPITTNEEQGPFPYQMTYVLRTAVPPATVAPAARAILRELDADVAMANTRTMAEIVADSSARMTFTMLLLVTAAAAALLLGTIGIYGVVSYLVSRRTGEIGIRLALGARPGDVARMVVRHGAGLTAAGLLLGLVGAMALVRLLETLLFGVRGTDPPTYVAVATVLGTVTLLACWLPARRAARLSPLVALHSE